MQNYHRLFWANQERSDKINSVYNSAGYHSMKSVGGSDDSDLLLDAVEACKSGNISESNYVRGCLYLSTITKYGNLPCLYAAVLIDCFAGE